MNADDRATPPSGGGFTPRNAHKPGTGQQPQRTSLRPVSGEMAQGRAPYAPTPAPASGQQPTVFTPQTGQQPQAPAQQPVSRPQSATPTHAASPVQPTVGTGGSETGMGGAFGAGVDKLKVFATKAKDDIIAGDDVAAAGGKGGPRKVRVLVSRLDPWSALKIGFLLSVALGIMTVVAVYIVWGVLNGMGFFALVNEWVARLFTEQELNLRQFFELNLWMSAAILIAVVNVVLLTALSAIGAFLYNTISRVVGGIYVTLTDD